jgi:hypothetical protein
MARITFYPLGNADCCLIKTDTGKLFAFDYADMYNPDDRYDKRMALGANFKVDIGWPGNKSIDVLAVTHGDNDHVHKIAEAFWLQHASKYQDADRIKFTDLWVPAALLVEEGADDDTRIIRQEARHRFWNKTGIRVFARPEHLRDWVEKQGKRFDDYNHLITGAGQTVPNVGLNTHGIEFFVHSPFAERLEDGLLDRNDNCLVMQATIRSGGRDTRFLITADSVCDCWNKIITITRAHGNDHRLAWDIFKIPHHCSYLSMADEKGTHKTKASPEFEWLLSQGTTRSIMVSTCWEIPDETTDQPPHLQTYRRYKETADALDASLIVTMEHPTKHNPKRVIIEVGGNGVTLKQEISTTGAAAFTSPSPRVG